MSNGNCLLDRHEVADIRTFKCRDCNGKGYFPWKELPDWHQQMNEKIEDEIWQNRKRNGSMTAVEVARSVRIQGCACRPCDTTGEVYA
jgi:hypothetical protein